MEEDDYYSWGANKPEQNTISFKKEISKASKQRIEELLTKCYTALVELKVKS